jgi:hypothetical protein
METVAIIATIASAAVSAASARRSGQNQQILSDYNASVQEENARLNLMGMQAASAQQDAAAEANFRMQRAEAEARFGNASRIEEDAKNQQAVNRLNLTSRRADMERQQAMQRAQIAASGVFETGTPLDLMAETAAIIQRDQEDQAWQFENESRTLFNQAANERFGGQLALAGAMIQRNVDKGEAALNLATGRARYRAGLAESEITRLTGRVAARDGRSQAVATLFGGVSSGAQLYNS